MSRLPPAAFSRDSSPASRQPLGRAKRSGHRLWPLPPLRSLPRGAPALRRSDTQPPAPTASPGTPRILFLALLLAPLSGLQVLQRQRVGLGAPLSQHGQELQGEKGCLAMKGSGLGGLQGHQPQATRPQESIWGARLLEGLPGPDLQGPDSAGRKVGSERGGGRG